MLSVKISPKQHEVLRDLRNVQEKVRSNGFPGELKDTVLKVEHRTYADEIADDLHTEFVQSLVERIGWNAAQRDTDELQDTMGKLQAVVALEKKLKNL